MYGLDKKVGLETENIFDETFCNSQNYIINTVDNLEIRIYISNYCLLYKKY